MSVWPALALLLTLTRAPSDVPITLSGVEGCRTVGPALALSPPPGADEEGPIEVVHSASRATSPLATLKTQRFVIRYTPDAAGSAHFLAGAIEGIRDEIRDALGRDWPGVTEIRLGFGREEYEALALSPPPSWAVALAWPNENVVLVEAHSLAQGDGQQTLRHELVHVALGRLGTGWPRWFQEGFAQLATGERKFRVSQYTTLARAVASDRVFHFDDLAQGFPEKPEDVEIAYAESLAFVEFLHDRHGAAAFGALTDHVGRGEGFELAFGRAFHTSLSVEEKAFDDELPRRYPWWPTLFANGTVLWSLTGGLVVLAWVRRRRDLKRWHLLQEEIERREDAAFALLAHLSKPANDDLPLEAPVPEWPWLVTITREK